MPGMGGTDMNQLMRGSAAANPFGGGGSDMDLLRQMEQQMKNKR